MGVPPIRAVLGGFHLLHANEQKLARVFQTLRAFGPPRLIPCHCTGDHATAALAAAFGGAVTAGRSGDVYSW